MSDLWNDLLNHFGVPGWVKLEMCEKEGFFFVGLKNDGCDFGKFETCSEEKSFPLLMLPQMFNLNKIEKIKLKSAFWKTHSFKLPTNYLLNRISN